MLYFVEEDEEIGCLDGDRSSLISKKSLIWFIVISPAKFQPPNPCITATNGCSIFTNFSIFEKLFTFLFSIYF